MNGDIDGFAEWWNTIASELGLVSIIKLTPQRRVKLAARLKERKNLREILEPKLRNRSQWAREARFPTFDQVLEPRLLTRLLEATYSERGSADPRQALIERLQRHRGKTVGKDSAMLVIGMKSVTNFSGFETLYTEMSMERLTSLVEAVEGQG